MGENGRPSTYSWKSSEKEASFVFSVDRATSRLHRISQLTSHVHNWIDIAPRTPRAQLRNPRIGLFASIKQPLELQTLVTVLFVTREPQLDLHHFRCQCVEFFRELCLG